MNNKLELAQNKFIGGISRMTDAFGINRFVVQLYAFLYLSDKPISLDEIAEVLGASKGNVSINIRELEKWGAVRNVWVKGSRKDYYEVEPDIKRVFLNKIKSAIGKRIIGLSSLIEEFRNTINSDDGNLTDEEKTVIRGYEEKLRKIEELKNLASSALTIADKLS